MLWKQEEKKQTLRKIREDFTEEVTFEVPQSPHLRKSHTGPSNLHSVKKHSVKIHVSS